MNTQPPQPPDAPGRLSPGYAIGIFLSVPAGVILAMRYRAPLSEIGDWAWWLVAMGPAIIVCLAAWTEGRLRSRS